MSAAATAAGYLYASGRLRGGRNKDEAEAQKPQAKRRTIRFAALPPEREPGIAEYERPAPRVKTVRVEYRTRRWSPEGRSLGSGAEGRKPEEPS